MNGTNILIGTGLFVAGFCLGQLLAAYQVKQARKRAFATYESSDKNI